MKKLKAFILVELLVVIAIIASCSYVVNLLIIHAINPRLEPMKFAVPQTTET